MFQGYNKQRRAYARKATGKLADAIRQLPDFCWQTHQEVLAYVEQIYEDVDPFAVGTVLHYMEKRGQIETKRINKAEYGIRDVGRRMVKMYKRPVNEISAAPHA